MAFPGIPTVAGGRILFTLNTAGGATKTFPNLSSLTKNAGDRLIAIIVEYDGNSTNAEFSNWGAGFTERADRAGTTTMAIGVAEKISDGTESGTFTVTTADTSTNDSVLILLSIPAAHASTPIEVSAMAVGTSAAADCPALSPSWGAADTLWMLVLGSGETSTTGSYTGVSAAGGGFGDYADSGITADAVGGVEAAVAFLQENTATQDPGSSTVDTSNARNAVLQIAVPPAPAAEAYEGGSTATVAATAEGAGTKAAQGGATAAVTATAEGAGEVGSFDREGGSTATVAATAEGAGTKASSSGATAAITATAEGAGAKASSSGATAAITAAAEGAGTKAAQGGATAPVLVTAEGAGVPGGADAYSGGSVALLIATAEGAGSKMIEAGAAASISAHAEGAGAKASSGASTASVIVTATGQGTALIPPPPDWLIWLWRAVRRRRTWAQ